MTAAPASAPVVDAGQLRIGEVLAEGGEGRVHLLPRQPHLLYKAYRRRGGAAHLPSLVAWPGCAIGPREAAVVRAASAWPCSVVVDGDEPVGLLVPRAARRFALRHRDGHSRLASLSYLTSDPAHRAAAYGVELPPPAAVERVGLVYALARLLSAFESGLPSVGHGDISTKNVLWSLQRGPEVFVLDCDSAELYGADGQPVSGSWEASRGGDVGRRRAMTPNWDDPAVPRGRNPTATTDRYSLALVFLRVVGAANFPVQARQRAGGPLEVRFPVPPTAAALVRPDAPVWGLCARSLSLTGANRRPPAAAWVGALEDLLDSMDGAAIAAAVRRAQGGGGAAPAFPVAGAETDSVPGDVSVVPELAPRSSRPWGRSGGGPGPGGRAAGYPLGGTDRSPLPPPAVGYRLSGPHPGAPALPPGAFPSGPETPGMWPELRAQLLRFLRWWAALHRGRGAVSVAAFLAVDLMILVAAAAVVALIISPVIEG